MREQVAHLDHRHAAVTQRRAELGQPLRDVVIERQLVPGNERHGRRRDDRLRHRREPEQRVLLHRRACFAVGEPGRAAIDEFAVARWDDHADEALRVELAGQYRIDALGERGIGRRLP